MRIFFRIFLFLFSFGIYKNAYGYLGNSSSGGGEILESAQNPWFLKSGSDSKFTYCVTADQSFGIDLEELAKITEQALSWWKNEFSNAYTPANEVTVSGKVEKIKVYVNASNYERVECNSSPESQGGVDLVFQFGLLSETQRQDFSSRGIDLTRHVALTNRISYSQSLKGNGFIYVSPDNGPNAFRGQNVLPNAWTEQYLGKFRLTWTLIHELGHVFGLAHSGTGFSVMSSSYTELLVSKMDPQDYVTFARFIMNRSSVFFPKIGDVVTAYGDMFKGVEEFRKFFEIDQKFKSINVKYNLNFLKIFVNEKLSSGPADSGWQELGKVSFEDGGKRRRKNLVNLWLPANQTRFPNLGTSISRLAVASSNEVLQEGQFIFKQPFFSEARSVFIQASPEHFQLGGVKENKIVPDLMNLGPGILQVSGWEDN